MLAGAPLAALLALGILAGWLGMGPVRTLRDASADPPAAPSAAEQVPASRGRAADTVLAQTTPAPANPTPQQCRVVGTTFAADDERDGLIWARLQNTGRTAATLQALELGWRGDMVLTAVLFDDGEGPRPLLEEEIKSPAYIPLGKAVGTALTLPPEASVRLGLRFQRAGDDNDALGALGPVVVLMREGCQLALHGISTSRCALEIGPLATDDTHLAFELSNTGEASLAVEALDLTWPDAVNGRLMALHVDGQPVLTFRNPPTRSPAQVELRRFVRQPLVIAPGAEHEVALVFEHEAAPEPYTVALSTSTGCTATQTTWLADDRDARLPGDTCGVEVGGFEPGDSRALLTLYNRQPVSNFLRALDVFWPVATRGPLVAILVDGEPAWRGEVARSPASLTLEQPAVIGQRTDIEVALVFASPVSDASATGLSGGDFTIIASFDGGCRVVHSTTASGSDGCRVSAGEPSIEPGSHELYVRLANSGAPAVLDALQLSWPEANGPLVGAWLEGTTLLDTPAEPGREPLRVDGKATRIERGTASTLRLRFARPAAEHGYVLTLQLQATDGQPCTTLIVRAEERQPDCQLSLGGPQIRDERFVTLNLANRGTSDAQIRFMRIDWPNPDRLTGLLRVTLVDPATEERRVVWADDVPELNPPAALTPTGTRAPVIPAGAERRLELQFDALLTLDPAADVSVLIGTVQGCQAVYSPRAGQAEPDLRRTLSGTLTGLPPAADGPFGCCWRVQTADEVVPVTVDAQTALVPRTVAPKVGDFVVVTALKRADGLYAEEIRIRSTPPGVTLRGPVEDLDGASPPTWLQVQRQQVLIVEDTVVDGQLEPGVVVTVRGNTDGRGRVVANEVSVRRTPQDERVTVEGYVQAAALDPMGDALQIWTVGEYEVWLRAGRLQIPVPELPQAGRPVRVTGQLTGRQLIAETVELLQPPERREIEGRLLAPPDDGLLGEWRVRTADGQEIRFSVRSATALDTSRAPASVGVAIRALLQRDADGSSVALHLETDWPK